MAERPPPLTLEEAAKILGRIETVLNTKEVVLIGGQVVALWAQQLVEYLDPFDASAVASGDVDFQGSKGPLVRAAELLGATVRLATMDNAPPMVGVAVFQDSDGYDRELDFLPAPHGLTAKDVADSAIRIFVKHADGHEIPLWVMHPQRCLESRVVNSGLPGKDTPLAWAQLRASIRCASAFSLSLLDQAEASGELRTAQKTVRKLNTRTYKFARKNLYAKRIARDRQIEVFDAVLCDPRLDDDFVHGHTRG